MLANTTVLDYHEHDREYQVESSNTTNYSFFNIFKDSLVAPFIEEPVKLLAVVWAIYFMPVKNIKSILLLGYAAGTGFKIREQFTFIAKNLDKELAYSISQALGENFRSFDFSRALYSFNGF